MQLHICIPSGDTVCADFMMSLTSMIMHIYSTPLPGVEEMAVKIVNRRGSLIVDSREDMIEWALVQGATHVLFLDSDMKFPEDAFHRLFSRNEPLVAANYVKRCLPTSPNSVSLMDQPCYTEPESTGLEEVASCGFGVMLIRASVFDSMPRPWFDTAWYTSEQGKRHIIGEDVYFCKKAQHAGNKVMIDHDLSQNVAHIGSWEFIHPMAKIE